MLSRQKMLFVGEKWWVGGYFFRQPNIFGQICVKRREVEKFAKTYYNFVYFILDQNHKY